MAERFLARQRNAGHLHLLGTALSRAGRLDESVRALEESIRLHGKGGDIDSHLFLALSRQRLGQTKAARQHLARVESWPKTARQDTWQQKIRWRLLREEARRLIPPMPRAADCGE